MYMDLLDFVKNKISVIRRYSLKTVSIVVVSLLLLTACGKNSAEGGNGYSDGGTSAQTADNESAGTGSGLAGANGETADNETEGIGISDDGGTGADGITGAGADQNDSDDSSNEVPEESYGLYNIELKRNYQWQCDGENQRMYLLTNPNVNVALRGAWLDTDISVMSGTTCVATTIVPIYLKAGDRVSFIEIPGISRRFYLATLDREACEYTCTYFTDWKDSDNESFTIPEDSYLMIDYSFANTSTDDCTDIDKSRTMTDDRLPELAAGVEVYRNAPVSEYENLYSDNDLLLAELEITEGRSKEGNPYVLIKIPSELSDGRQVMPELQQTSWMQYYAYPCYDKITDEKDRILFRSVLSPMMYAQVYHTAFTINAGLFNIFSNTPQGQTIIDGVVVTNNPMKDDIGDPISPNTECYAMTIDAAGILDYAKYESGVPFRTIDADSLVAAGIRDAITGWGCVVYDGKSVVVLDPSAVNASTIFYEKVHRRKVAHQVIGQDRAGNYYILSTNDVDSGYGYGLNYDEAADIMIAAGATYAYMLDGGDSVATVVDGEQITTVYYEDYGKPVPTVINFVAK